MRLLDTRAGRVVAWILGAVLLSVLSLALGGLVPHTPLIPIAVAVFILALGITAAEPAAIPLLVTPLILVVQRADLGPADLSISDLALAAATVAALVFTTRPFSREMRSLLWFNLLYQVTTIFTVLFNPFTANTVEWFHAWMLVSGALLMGWTIGRAGYAHVALTLLLASSLALAVVTLVHAALQYRRGDFSAVYLTWPYGMHKNFVGTILAFHAAIAFARPGWMRWKAPIATAAFWVLAAGLLVTQSRQGIIGLGVAIFFIAWRVRTFDHRRSMLIATAMVPALALVATMVRDQIEEDDQFNSWFQRLSWLADTVDFWLTSPWVGHGLRFWYVGGPIAFQPPNAELEVLASSGAVGLAGFLCMWGGVLLVVWRMDPRFGTVAFAVLLSRIVQSQFDLFWVSVQVSVPFLVAGIALGALAHHEAQIPWRRGRGLVRGFDDAEEGTSEQPAVAASSRRRGSGSVA